MSTQLLRQRPTGSNLVGHAGPAFGDESLQFRGVDAHLAPDSNGGDEANSGEARRPRIWHLKDRGGLLEGEKSMGHGESLMPS
jgi:hypothetical protein